MFFFHVSGQELRHASLTRAIGSWTASDPKPEEEIEEIDAGNGSDVTSGRHDPVQAFLLLMVLLFAIPEDRNGERS